jgi:hypothetical protein
MNIIGAILSFELFILVLTLTLWGENPFSKYCDWRIIGSLVLQVNILIACIVLAIVCLCLIF